MTSSYPLFLSFNITTMDVAKKETDSKSTLPPCPLPSPGRTVGVRAQQRISGVKTYQPPSYYRTPADPADQREIKLIKCQIKMQI